MLRIYWKKLNQLFLLNSSIKMLIIKESYFELWKTFFQPVSEVRNLGSWFDLNFSMSTHISKSCSAFSWPSPSSLLKLPSAWQHGVSWPQFAMFIFFFFFGGGVGMEDYGLKSSFLIWLLYCLNNKGIFYTGDTPRSSKRLSGTPNSYML